MKWPFGTKYRGWQVDQIPLDYLEWADRSIGVLHGALKDEVRQVIAAAKKIERKVDMKKADVCDTHFVVPGQEHFRLKRENEELRKKLDRCEVVFAIKQREVFSLTSELLKVQMNKIFSSVQPKANGSGSARRIYRELALKWHPDRGGSEDAMKALGDFKQMLEKEN